ncbi:MAG TPA: hypothetical protein VLA16_18775, partial [Ideonella sp.]|nr:hypothetical protein [Ideonella sp.]
MPDAVERVAASVVGLAARRHGGSGVLWREGVVVASASVLWRLSQVSQVSQAPRVALVLPDGEQVEGELRGLDGGTDLAAITVTGGALPLPERV